MQKHHFANIAPKSFNTSIKSLETSSPIPFFCKLTNYATSALLMGKSSVNGNFQSLCQLTTRYSFRSGPWKSRRCPAACSGGCTTAARPKASFSAPHQGRPSQRRSLDAVDALPSHPLTPYPKKNVGKYRNCTKMRGNSGRQKQPVSCTSISHIHLHYISNCGIFTSFHQSLHQRRHPTAIYTAALSSRCGNETKIMLAAGHVVVKSCVTFASGLRAAGRNSKSGIETRFFKSLDPLGQLWFDSSMEAS